MNANDLQNAKTISWFNESGKLKTATVKTVTKPMSPWTSPVVITTTGERVRCIEVLAYTER